MKTTEMRFREFYESRFRHTGGQPITTADEMRAVLQAYQEYRRATGISDDALQSARAKALFEKMQYHMGAGELAELSGETAREKQHHQAFLRLLEEWLCEINEVSLRGGNAASVTDAEEESSLRERAKARLRFWQGLLHFWRR